MSNFFLDIYRHWLVQVRGFNPEKAELEADQTYQYMKKKIAQIKDTEEKAFQTKKENKILGKTRDELGDC